MSSVFRTPRTKSIQGPRGTVQLVSGGLEGWGEWQQSWNRDAAATAAYMRVFLPRPRSLVQVSEGCSTRACVRAFMHGISAIHEQTMLLVWLRIRFCSRRKVKALVRLCVRERERGRFCMLLQLSWNHVAACHSCASVCALDLAW